MLTIALKGDISQNFMYMRKKKKWAGKLALMGEIINGYKILAGKPDGKKIFGTHTRRWEAINNMNLKEVRHKGTGSIHMTKKKDPVNTTMNLQTPQKVEYTLPSQVNISSSRGTVLHKVRCIDWTPSHLHV
jgi:hypothetical protein